MTLRSREEILRVAAEARKAFYSGKPRRPAPTAAHASRAPSAKQPRVTKVAQPCPEPNAWWRNLPSKARSLAVAVASADVSDEVYAIRMAICRGCPYSSEMGARLYCGCCHCPRWQVGRMGSHLEYKNRKAGWGCPRPDPAFGPIVDAAVSVRIEA